MDRKVFIKTVWKKGVIPLLIIITLFFCLQFLFNVYNERGTERIMVLLILLIAVFYGLVYLMIYVLSSISSKIFEILPETLKLTLKVFVKFIKYTSPIISGVILYHFWQKDWKTASFGILIIMALSISSIYNNEKEILN